MARPVVIWRQWVAGATAAAVLFAFGFLIGHGVRAPSPVAPPTPPAAVPPPPVAVPPPALAQRPALRRADLLVAVRAAASAYAAGEPMPDGSLIGRPFDLTLPFGCTGPSAPGFAQGPRWEVDPKAGVRRIFAQPESWLDDPILSDLLASGQLEAARGFWVRRPWLLAEHCPKPAVAEAAPAEPTPAKSEVADTKAARSKAAPATPPKATPEAGPGALVQTVGLVSLFRTGGSRIDEQKGAAFEVTSKLDPETPPDAPHEFRLVLKGRIGDFGEGRAVRCQATGVNREPRCLVAVELDDVRIEDPALGETLADWPS